MRLTGFGCLGCGGLLALVGAAGLVLAAIPGVINSSATMNVVAPSGGLCISAVVPVLMGLALVILGGRGATT